MCQDIRVGSRCSLVFMPSIPKRDEVSVEPNTDPSKTVGWTVQIYNGPEVFRFNPDGSVDQTPLQSAHDVQEGVELAVPGFHGGFHRMKVERDSYGVFTARSETLTAPLNWDIGTKRNQWSVPS